MHFSIRCKSQIKNKKTYTCSLLVVIFTFIMMKVEKVHVQPLDNYNTSKKTKIAVFCIWVGLCGYLGFFIDFSADIIIRLLQQVQLRMSP